MAILLIGTVEHFLCRRSLVTVEAKDFVETQFVVDIGSGGDPTTLTLSHGALVRCTYVDAAGAALRTYLRFNPLYPDGNGEGSLSRRASEGRGHMYEERLPPGTWQITANADDGGSPFILDRVTVVDGDTRTLNLVRPSKR